MRQFKLIHFLIYPFKSIFSNTIALIKSLFNIFSCIDGNATGRYRMFNAENAINFYWYDTLGYNISKFGKKKYSNTITHEPYLVGRWFHISKFSISIFNKSNLFTVFFSWLLILFSMTLFANEKSTLMIVLIIMMTSLGSNYYSQMVLQNYNIIGWSFFPLFIWSLDSGQHYLLSIILVLFFLSSITVYTISVFYFVVMAMINNWVLYIDLLVVLPSIILAVGRLYPLMKSRVLNNQINKVFGAIGFFDKQTIKYSRKAEKKLTLSTAFRITSYGIFGLSVSFYNQSIPLYFIMAYSLLILNQLFARFADKQSIDMLILIVCVYYLFQKENFILLGLYWIFVANPIPYLFNTHKKDNIYEVAIMQPFDSRPIIEAFNKFYYNIKEGSRVLFAFNDPMDDYNSIYDGYRHLMEPAHFFANKKSILVFPHLWAVVDLNYHGAPNIWGRSLKAVNENSSLWKMDYLVYYRLRNEPLPMFLNEKFEFISNLDWNDYLNAYDLTGVKELPIWYMLKKKETK
jgi:hypothetical protein